MSEHAKGPLSHGLDSEPPDCAIMDEHGGCVAFVQLHGNVNTIMRTGEQFSHADARRIVTAWNCFDDLLAIAEAYVADCEDTFYDIEEMNAESKALYQAAKAAIKKAMGE